MKHSNIQKSKEIHLYIVGFPKSGTSWLARLMANLLRIPIKNNQNNTEATVEINRRLHLQYKGSFIAKVHLLPQYLIPQIDPQLSRIIYIQRDIRAVALSSFFYFKVPQRFSYLFLLNNHPKLPFLKNILRLAFYPFARIMMARFIDKFLKNEIMGQVGTWQQNHAEWNAFKNNSTQITKPLLTIVSYSSLLDNPFYELKKILDSLHLNCISNEHIQQSIEEESFQAMKNRQNNNTPDYEKALLRTAQKEDWKNYFTNYNLKQLQTASTVEDLARAEQKYIV